MTHSLTACPSAPQVNETLTSNQDSVEGECARLREENKALQTEVSRLSSQLNDLRSRPENLCDVFARTRAVAHTGC